MTQNYHKSTALGFEMHNACGLTLGLGHCASCAREAREKRHQTLKVLVVIAFFLVAFAMAGHADYQALQLGIIH